MPDQSLPPILMTSDPGSFAHATIVERKPQIISQVIADNAYPSEIVDALERLRNEIANSPIKPLREAAADVAFWNTELSANYAGRTWLEVPWYFAETYFYRRVLEAVGYFRPGEVGRGDPFQAQKHRQIDDDIRKLAAEWEHLSILEPGARFEALLHSCLWGNRADLSNFTVRVGALGGLAVQQERHLILIDHTERVGDLLSGVVPRVDFICDNVGSDLLFDLALADFLLCQGWAHEIHLHLKNQPFFVSDAMPADACLTIDRLQQAPSAAMQAWGQRLTEDLAAGRLVLETDTFWTTCLMFRRLPPHLLEGVAAAGLALVKGDVNYRRLLGDRHWPHTTRMEDVCAYFPAPFVALRTLKGEIMVGLQVGQAEALQVEDSTWLINGKRGVIHLVVP
ncbi:MAG: protein-glutamate O-methyltransferase family protein [Anaerolineae bacterium]|nr:protein-glutamate O-methyltransferase family protein [Anaerolineae bacterium]